MLAEHHPPGLAVVCGDYHGLEMIAEAEGFVTRRYGTQNAALILSRWCRRAAEGRAYPPTALRVRSHCPCRSPSPNAPNTPTSSRIRPPLPEIQKRPEQLCPHNAPATAANRHCPRRSRHSAGNTSRRLPTIAPTRISATWQPSRAARWCPATSGAALSKIQRCRHSRNRNPPPLPGGITKQRV